MMLYLSEPDCVADAWYCVSVFQCCTTHSDKIHGVENLPVIRIILRSLVLRHLLLISSCLYIRRKLGTVIYAAYSGMSLISGLLLLLFNLILASNVWTLVRFPLNSVLVWLVLLIVWYGSFLDEKKPQITCYVCRS